MGEVGGVRRNAGEVTAVPISGPGGELLAAMMFLATLAYPESWDARNRAIEAMRSWMVRTSRASGRRVPKGQKLMPRKNQDATLRRLRARINKRLIAASVASRIITGERYRGREVSAAPEDLQRTRVRLMNAGHSFESAVAHTLTKHETSPGPALSLKDFARRAPEGVANFLHNSWAPEVLHLAMALRQISMAWKRREDPRPFGLAALLARPDWSRAALEKAEKWAWMLDLARAERPAFRNVRADRFIRLIAE